MAVQKLAHLAVAVQKPSCFVRLCRSRLTWLWLCRSSILHLILLCLFMAAQKATCFSMAVSAKAGSLGCGCAEAVSDAARRHQDSGQPQRQGRQGRQHSSQILGRQPQPMICRGRQQAPTQQPASLNSLSRILGLGSRAYRVYCCECSC